MAQQKPRPLVTLSTIAMVLGGVGIILALIGLGQWITGNFSGIQPSYGNEELIKIQRSLRSELALAMAPWRMINIPLLILTLIVSLLLAFGGYQTLNVREFGRKLLLILIFVLIPLDIVRAIINTIIQHKIADITVSHVARIAGPGQPQAPHLDWISGFSRIVSYAGLAFSMLWSAAKVTFYVLTAKYLRRPDIVRLFQTRATPPTPPPMPTG